MLGYAGRVAKFLAVMATQAIAVYQIGFREANFGVGHLINFKGAQHPKSVILYPVYFYVRFPVSYRYPEQIMAERGVFVDHSTLNRWVEKCAGVVADEAHRRKVSTGQSWRTDEIYVKAKGVWIYL